MFFEMFNAKKFKTKRRPEFSKIFRFIMIHRDLNFMAEAPYSPCKLLGSARYSLRVNVIPAGRTLTRDERNDTKLD